MSKDPIPYISHMRDAADAVLSYASTHSYEDFSESDWDQAAAIRNLEIIGEAATNISDEYRSQHPDIPWRDIIDFRNVAIHEYMEVDIQIVWSIIQHDLPPLREQLRDILGK